MSERAAVGEIDIHRVLHVLQRRKRVIIVLTVLVPLVALGYSLAQSKKYTATTTALFQDPQLTQQITGSLSILPAEDPARVSATNLQLAQLGVVARATRQQLHEPIDVAVSGNASTDLVTVSATSTNPAQAAKVANAYTNQYVAFRRHQDATTILGVRSLIQRELAGLPASERRTARGRSLSTTANRLGVLAALQTGNAAVVQTANIPTSPSSPLVVRNVILGLVIGLMLGLALAFLLDVVDRRVRDPSELEEIFQRPVLASVPELKELKSVAGAKWSGSLAGQAFEPFQMLRTNLRYFNVDRELKVVLVTSSQPGEGKTTVAFNLAAAAARAGSRVLLIEADLRRPTIAARYDVSMVGGLSILLSRQGSLSEAVAQIPVRRFQHGGEEHVVTVDVLPAGPMPPNPADLLESNRMGQLLEDARRDYDLVVVDTPPASVVSDASPLIGRVDGVLVVARLRQVSRDAVVHLHKQLERMNAPIIGVVVNTVHRGDTYGYGYGYGYGYSREGRAYLEATPDQEFEQELVASESNGRGHAPPETVKDVNGPRLP